MRTYATAAEYAASPLTGDVAPSDAALALASLEIDTALIGVVYDVDADNYPTNPSVRAALRDATCAVLAWWDETGDTTGSGAGMIWASASIGDASYSRPPGQVAGGSPALPDRARKILQVAGLTTAAIWARG